MGWRIDLERELQPLLIRDDWEEKRIGLVIEREEAWKLIPILRCVNKTAFAGLPAEHILIDSISGDESGGQVEFVVRRSLGWNILYRCDGPHQAFRQEHLELYSTAEFCPLI